MLKEERNHLGWHTQQTGEASWKKGRKFSLYSRKASLELSCLYAQLWNRIPMNKHHSGHSEHLAKHSELTAEDNPALTKRCKTV